MVGERLREPWCLIGKASWGVAQAIKVPEKLAPMYIKHGWMVLIRDSDFPVPAYLDINDEA